MGLRELNLREYQIRLQNVVISNVKRYMLVKYEKTLENTDSKILELIFIKSYRKYNLTN